MKEVDFNSMSTQQKGLYDRYIAIYGHAYVETDKAGNILRIIEPENITSIKVCKNKNVEDLEEMTIEEIRKSKREAEEKIKDILATFLVNAGLQELSVYVSTGSMEWNDGRKEYNVDITAKI